MDFSSIVAIPSIAIICCLLAQGYKSFTKLDNKHIPFLCGLMGLVLGVFAYYFVPSLIHSENVVTAASVGVVSGWAATAANQFYKQYFDK